MWVAIVLAVVFGAGVALQSRVNGQLAAAIDDPYTAALISFGSGLVILLVALAFWRPGREGVGRVRDGLRAGRIAWWMVLGGLAGAWFVTTQGLSAGVLGVALFTVAIVAGQTIGGIVFDLIGLGPGGRRPLTIMRVLGALLALAAIVVGRLGAARARRAAAAHAAAVHRRRRRRLAAGGQRPGEGRGRAAHSPRRSSTSRWAPRRSSSWRSCTRHRRLAVVAARPSPGSTSAARSAASSSRARRCSCASWACCCSRSAAWPVSSRPRSPSTCCCRPPQRPIDLATIGGTVLALVAVVVASIRWTRREHVADAAADARGGQSSELKFGAGRSSGAGCAPGLGQPADVEPAEQALVRAEPVHRRDGRMPRVRPGAPHHAPAGLVEQQAEQVGDAGGRRPPAPTRGTFGCGVPTATTASSSGARSGLAASFAAASPVAPAASASARRGARAQSPRSAMTRHGRSDAWSATRAGRLEQREQLARRRERHPSPSTHERRASTASQRRRSRSGLRR